jgi:hypothetical protein
MPKKLKQLKHGLMIMLLNKPLLVMLQAQEDVDFQLLIHLDVAKTFTKHQMVSIK